MLEEARNNANAAELRVTENRKRLSEFAVELQKVVVAARPLRDHVEVGRPSTADAETAQLLPQPLYFIYAQLAAAGQAYNLPVSVSIAGTCLRLQ
jgi:THO complex subunit 5